MRMYLPTLTTALLIGNPAPAAPPPTPPAIDAGTADVHCHALLTMQGFASVLSISKDARVRADGFNPHALAQQRHREGAAGKRESEAAEALQAPTFDTL